MPGRLYVCGWGRVRVLRRREGLWGGVEGIGKVGVGIGWV